MSVADNIPRIVLAARTPISCSELNQQCEVFCVEQITSSCENPDAIPLCDVVESVLANHEAKKRAFEGLFQVSRRESDLVTVRPYDLSP